MSLDTATTTSKDWIEHASARMPTGNHGPHDSMNTHAGASNCSQGNDIGSGAISSTHDTQIWIPLLPIRAQPHW